MGCHIGKSKEQPQVLTIEGREQQKRKASASNQEFADVIQFLLKVPLFKRLPKAQHPILALACLKREFRPGEDVIVEGEVGHEFFVIESGTAAVAIVEESGGSVKVATLGAGDYFGENALLREEPRTATITAETDLVTFTITRDKFTDMGLMDKLQFAMRKAVTASPKEKQPTESPEKRSSTVKTEEERHFIAAALRKNANLNTMVHLDEAKVEQMVDAAWREEVECGKEVITQGDTNADFFYLVESGCFDVLVVLPQSDDDEKKDEDGKEDVAAKATCVGCIGPGGSFGELALLYFAPRAATVKARDTASVWVISRQHFKSILMKSSQEKAGAYVKYIDRVDILEPLVYEEKTVLAGSLVEIKFVKDEVVYREGEQGHTFYILYDGELSVSKLDEVKLLVASEASETSEAFGQQCLLEEQSRNETIKVISETAKALAMDRDSFEMLIGPLNRLSQKRNSERRTAGQGSIAKSYEYEDLDKRSKIYRKDLFKVGILGCGTFGAVELWEHKHTGETFAIRGLSKGYVVQCCMQSSVENEKNILLMTSSPFIVKLYETYSGTQTLYFLLEACLGGELYTQYTYRGFHGSEPHAMFYIAGVIYAFEHCHARRIIYRDLKPENLLFDAEGHIKLTDMGLAKLVVGKTYTTCGTPDYFAPEMIGSCGHTTAVDWWTLGILLFELMAGNPPFESPYPMQIYTKVIKGIDKLQFPTTVPLTVAQLIKAILRPEPIDRLPCRLGGIKNIQGHTWYKGFDWVAMKNLEISPPFKPHVESPRDTRNFFTARLEYPQFVEYADDGTNWDKDFPT